MRRISPAKLLIAGAVIPVTTFAVLYKISRRFRTLVGNADPRPLSLFQTARIIGAAMFTHQYVRGKIPASYGLTVALCDLAAGATAPLAVRSGSTRILKLWNQLGLAALIVSVCSGVLTSPRRWDLFFGKKTSQPTSSFPLLLVPTIFGPATFVAHLTALAALRSQPARLLSSTNRT